MMRVSLRLRLGLKRTRSRAPGCVVLVDVDGDGRLDVVTASSSDDTIAWYKNEAGSPPTWTPYTISTTADFARGVFAADLDDDGRVDVVSGSSHDDRVMWYKNGGGSPPTWTPYTISTVADGVFTVFATDFDGDGRVDVLSACQSNDQVVWYKNSGGSPLAWTPFTVTSTADGAAAVFVADLDGDGRKDVLSGNFNDGNIAWHKNSLCAAGQYGVGGAAPCMGCPEGTYGATSGLTSAACTGACTAGFYCPPASTRGTQVPALVMQYAVHPPCRL